MVRVCAIQLRKNKIGLGKAWGIKVFMQREKIVCSVFKICRKIYNKRPFKVLKKSEPGIGCVYGDGVMYGLLGSRSQGEGPANHVQHV